MQEATAGRGLLHLLVASMEVVGFGGWEAGTVSTSIHSALASMMCSPLACCNTCGLQLGYPEIRTFGLLYQSVFADWVCSF